MKGVLIMSKWKPDKPWVSRDGDLFVISQRINAVPGERKWSICVQMTPQQARRAIKELQELLENS